MRGFWEQIDAYARTSVDSCHFFAHARPSVPRNSLEARSRHVKRTKEDPRRSTPGVFLPETVDRLAIGPRVIPVIVLVFSPDSACARNAPIARCGRPGLRRRSESRPALGNSAQPRCAGCRNGRLPERLCSQSALRGGALLKRAAPSVRLHLRRVLECPTCGFVSTTRSIVHRLPTHWGTTPRPSPDR